MFRKLFNKRSAIGTLLLFCFIGEVNVASLNGLLSLDGALFLILLYFLLFHIYDSLIVKYSLSFIQLAIVSFVLYGVFVTGFVNAELLHYLRPERDVVGTTLIRIHGAFFAPFVFYLLHLNFPRKNAPLSIYTVSGLFTAFIFLISLSGILGIPNSITTLRNAPILSTVFLSLSAALLLLLPRLKRKKSDGTFSNRILTTALIFWVVISFVPHVIFFPVLVATMAIGGIAALFNKKLRNMLL
jgi:hypothetical protein